MDLCPFLKTDFLLDGYENLLLPQLVSATSSLLERHETSTRV